ncbi:unnamed protein product [Medioppia subpectinata]|uniref:CUB domain-containing protein n=1 Tax=Medioppia subpectinata TaxID=1979941 RepID=A0A7R9KPA2_9ACAR|nr:unnamed protein product [Medioppia subpectinata]CAG2106954.1 unnamed protein product [Medioppia subpectinata]
MVNVHVSEELVTEYSNPSFPERDTRPDTYTLRIVVTDLEVSQLRLDFTHMELGQPNVDGHCLGDTLSVAIVEDNGSTLSAVPTLCGHNDRQHIYVEIAPGQSSNTKRFVDVVIDTTPESEYRWHIIVTQITRVSSHLAAPTGCLQYFTLPSGQLQSFNYGHQYISNMDYAICIQRKQKTCRVIYSADQDEFSLDSTQVDRSRSGVGDNNCDNDYLAIEGGSQYGNIPTHDRYCGGSLNSEPDLIMGAPADRKLRNLQRGVYVCCALSLIATVVLLVIILIINMAAGNNSYYDKWFVTSREFIISIAVISIVTQFLGIYSAAKQSYITALAYSIICSLLAGVTLAYAILYNVLAWILVVILFACVPIASLYTKHIRVLKKRALNATNVAIYGDHQNIMLEMPLTDQQINYPIHNGGQPSYIVSGQPGQMHITGALPNSVGPYQSQPYGYPQTPTNPSYTEPMAQPPGYSQSQVTPDASVAYSIISSLLTIVTIAFAILYHVVGILVVALFVSVCVASVYAKHIRATSKRALTSNVAIYGGQQNIMFQMPINGQQTNYPAHNGGQPNYIVSGQPGQMNITSALPNSVAPYQSQSYVCPQTPTNPSYTEPTLQPPGYSQSHVTPDASGSAYSAPDAQNIAATVEQHKTVQVAPVWHT